MLTEFKVGDIVKIGNVEAIRVNFRGKLARIVYLPIGDEYYGIETIDDPTI